MIQYILECIAFQLIFLIIYDFFLKRETFFQWNRIYLIGTYILSMVLPWVKIEALKTQVPNGFYAYPEILWNTNNTVSVMVEDTSEAPLSISWEFLVLFGGMFLATLYFGYKLFQIYRLKQKGEIHYFNDFTQVIIRDSNLAFSFFKFIFLGERIVETEHKNIIQHELIHINQRHSYDLLFFELMRIVAWFNPLVYVYQNRISELHEFIADAEVAKTNKKEQYQFLLSQVFQTQNISFINQFAAKSLIKKRVVMLQKTKSKKVNQLKYLALIPFILVMVVYTSCEVEKGYRENENIGVEELEQTVIIGYTQSIDTTFVPFAAVEEVPVFPGCEDAYDKKKCFKDRINEHIRKNFRYPSEAQAQNIEGRVNTMFTVDKSGYITNLKMRGPAKTLEQETERIIRKLPHMIPGKVKGLSVNVLFSVPVVFKLAANNVLSSENINDAKDAYHNLKNENKDFISFVKIEEVPIFPGCEETKDKRGCFQNKVNEHIRKHFRYPEAAQEQGIEGRVSVMFTIDKNGNITNFKKRGPAAVLEQEAERIIMKLPKMKPGKHKGENTNVPFSIPIHFKLK